MMMNFEFSFKSVFLSRDAHRILTLRKIPDSWHRSVKFPKENPRMFEKFKKIPIHTSIEKD